MEVCVLAKNGERLMPMKRRGKVRHMLEEGRAVIVQHENPFTIQLTYETTHYVQDIELCMDTGYEHIGVSVKSEREEFFGAQYDLLTDEKQRHDDRRTYRRTRRNRLRHRQPRFNNRCKQKWRNPKREKGKQRKKAKARTTRRKTPVLDPTKQPMNGIRRIIPKSQRNAILLPSPNRMSHTWLAPSIRNKAERHVDLVVRYVRTMPIQDVYLEKGSFDTMLLRAIERGDRLPEGVDYQHGGCWKEPTLRAAVFQRDHYTCVICGRSIKDHAIFHAHHAFFWQNRHGNTLSELVTVCEKCHTAANHQPGGKLYGFVPPAGTLINLAPAAFMNIVRWYIVGRVKEEVALIDPTIRVHTTYGTNTRKGRQSLGAEKSHINDAWAMGQFHPIQRAEPEHYQKRRRNNRILEKFYDAKYIDLRDPAHKKTATGMELSCGRTRRNIPRRNPNSLRQYRGQKVKAGRRAIRHQRYSIPAGTIVLWKGNKYPVVGIQHYGQYLTLRGPIDLTTQKATKISASVRDVEVLRLPGGWVIK